MKYIKKEITNTSLQTNECWIASALTANVFTNKATITFVGFKNAEAFMSGAKPDPTMKKTVTVDFSSLDTYEPMWQELTLKCLSQADSPFLGATLSDTDEVTDGGV